MSRPYSSSGSGSGVVLRHRAAAAACAYLTVDAAAAVAYCTPEGAAQIRPTDGFLHNHCPNSRGFTKGFLTWFSTTLSPTTFSQKSIFLPCVLPFVLTV